MARNKTSGNLYGFAGGGNLLEGGAFSREPKDEGVSGRDTHAAESSIQSSAVGEIIDVAKPDLEKRYRSADFKWPLKTEPFEVQLEALSRSLGHNGYGHFLEQGLGKSQLTLAEWLLLKLPKLVIVSPKSFMGGWKKEIEDTLPTSVPLLVWNGNVKDSKAFFRKHKKWIFVLNYEATWGEKIKELIPFITGEDVMCAADESIKIKNFKSATSKAVRAIGDACEVTRALSGKALTQGPHDLWAQLKFMKKLGKTNYFNFRYHFCVLGGWQGKQIVGAKNTEELNAIVSQTAFVARKKDWGKGIPDKVYMNPRLVEMTPAQKKRYAEMYRDLVLSFEGMDPILAQQAVTRDGKLRQIASGFIYTEAGKVMKLVSDELNPRIKFVKEFYEDEVEGKLVVSALFVPSVDALMSELSKAGLNPAVIRGGMTTEAVEEEKRRFNEDEDCRTIVLQQVAAKYGHTLLGTQRSPCSNMLMYENSYSLDDRSQIEDRINRWGAQFPSMYTDIISSPLDRRAIRSLQKKEDVAASVLGYMRQHGTLPHTKMDG